MLTFTHTIFTVLLAAIFVATAEGNCGRPVCSTKWATKKFCNKAWRVGKCEMERCPSGLWRCRKRASPTPTPRPSKVTLVARFSWPNGEDDMDTAINMLGKQAGPFCGGSPYINFTSGDDTSDGGAETYRVDVTKALAESGRSSLWMSFNAVWYDRTSFQQAVLSAYLEDETGRRLDTVDPFFIMPASDDSHSCAFSMAAIGTVRLKPTPKLSVNLRLPTNLFLIANFTAETTDSRFNSAVEFAGKKNDVEHCGGAPFVTSTKTTTGRKVTESHVVDITRAKKMGSIGDESTVKLYASSPSWLGDRHDPRLTLYLQDRNRRRYATIYTEEPITPGGWDGPLCSSHQVATADIIYSDEKVRLSASFF